MNISKKIYLGIICITFTSAWSFGPCTGIQHLAIDTIKDMIKLESEADPVEAAKLFTIIRRCNKHFAKWLGNKEATQFNQDIKRNYFTAKINPYLNEKHEIDLLSILINNDYKIIKYVEILNTLRKIPLFWIIDSKKFIIPDSIAYLKFGGITELIKLRQFPLLFLLYEQNPTIIKIVSQIIYEVTNQRVSKVIAGLETDFSIKPMINKILNNETVKNLIQQKEKELEEST